MYLNPNPNPNPSLLLKMGKVGEPIEMTTDTVIKGESTEISVCSQPLSIMLMYLNPNPNPDFSISGRFTKYDINCLELTYPSQP